MLLHLPGLTPDHPVHALAVVGLATVLDAVAPRAELKYTRRPEGSLHQHLTVNKLPAKLRSVDALAAHLITDMHWWAGTVLLDGAPNTLRISPRDGAPWITAVVNVGNPRLIRQLRGLIDTDLTRTTVDGARLRRTRLDFTAGQIEHLGVVRKLIDILTADDLTATLTGEHVRTIDGGPTLRWSGTPTAPSAYRAEPASTYRPARPMGIEWLAWLGLAAYPVRDIHLTDHLHWPAWETPLTPAAVLHLAGAAATHGGPWTGTAWSCRIRPSDPTHPERYWEFGPAASAARPAHPDRHPLRIGYTDATLPLAAPTWFDDPLDANTPLGAPEIGWLYRIDENTATNWGFDGTLPDPHWTVSGRPAWRAEDVVIAALQQGRCPWPLTFPPHPRTEQLLRAVLARLDALGGTTTLDLLDGHPVHPEWNTAPASATGTESL